ncbi:MAG: 3-deoxy-D-manno-octulosonic acid transferase [Bacteroidales bacterium]|jgi:3-deoxy-D-manno-octulosonic-acid transferase|nr:3-deoxy-D-manno-octulosonic acid transferase [Bacteroidales bacterium]
MRIFYQLGVNIYWFIIRCFALFNDKAKRFIRGRINWKTSLQALRNPDAKYIWIHCASLGEFEQGRPFIEEVKRKFPQYSICLTFFSPSGYEIQKNYSLADIVFYLPKDSTKNANAFLDILKPEISFFVKYEFWFHYLNQLQKHAIPTFLISGIFRENQIFFKAWAGFFRNMLGMYQHIFVQDEPSLLRLKQIGVLHASIAGDTRFDRVWEITKEDCKLEVFEQFVKDDFCIVAGSTWPQDESILKALMQYHSELKLILAPHETDSQHIQQIEQSFKDIPFVKFSNYETTEIDKSRVLIIDSVGLLSKLYRYGKIAYIGGGFGKGIHNTLEAACYGLPVIFGPNYEKFKEACDLIAVGAAFPVNSEKEMIQTVQDFQQQSKQKDVGQIALNYISQKRGATQKIMEVLKKNDVFAQE